MNLYDYAVNELTLAGYYREPSDINTMMARNVIELIQTFAEQGHSGMSAPFCISLFERLAHYKPLSPLTGEDSEWEIIPSNDSIRYQNKRYSSVFKEEGGRAYDIDGIVFEDADGGRYTNSESRVYIEFPYTPETKIVKR